ncbi:MAG: Xaa-Pro peptidase family protein [Trueperaceae bacterium]
MRQRDDLVFPMSEYDRRLGALRARMAEQELDAMVTTTPENICYLCGFDSPGHYWFQAMVVPLEGEPFTYSRLLETSGVEAGTWIEANLAYHDSDDIITGLAAQLYGRELGEARIGIERDGWFFSALQQERFTASLPNAELVDASGLIEAGRLVKSDLEVEVIRAAARATDAAMAAGVAACAEGVSENDVAAATMEALIRAGSHWPAIVPFVASGERGAIGHATWDGRVLRDGDTVFLELAGCRHRYHAPQMRTVVVGRADPRVRDAFTVVDEAFQIAMNAIRPGVVAGEVDRLCRAHIAQAGFGENQASRTAYSVGIGLPPDWGEGHVLSMKPGEARALEPNMTFHLLPWVQIPGKGGVGCTETVRVTDTGCERLTQGPRELFEAGRA